MTHRWLPLVVTLVVGGMIGAYALNTLFSDEPEREGAGAAIERWPEEPQQKRRVVSDPDQLIAMFDSLYTIVDEEVEERRRLQEALADVRRDLDTIRKIAPSLFIAAEVQDDSVVSESGEPGPQTQLDLFLEAGFDQTQAADLQKRQDEFAMQELYLRDRASREGWTNSRRYRQEFRKLRQNRLSIRGELGDEDYDRYLFATGQSNRVSVSTVLQNSPAKQAGLATGDAILSYDGQRVFSLRELTALQAQGSAGELVAMDISRGGQQMQIWIPRGPIGFQSSFQSVNPNAQN
ncbi:MAG: PDZ domain-containing protein [Pseudomonadales bacterium]